MKALFTEGPSQLTRLVVCLVLSFLLISIDHRQHHLESVRAGLSILVYPIQLAVDIPVDVLRAAVDNVSTRSSLLQQNKTLRDENLKLSSRMYKYHSLEQENRRLRSLLDSSYVVSEKVLVADLLAVDSNPSVREILINKGARNGVFLGQPIVDADGIMGQIIHVGPLSSTAMLITDVRHAIPVTVNRSGVRAVAVGTDMPDLLTLNFVPNNSDVKQDDLIVSSGMGGVFPAGYPVGVVTRIVIDPTEAFAQISIRPSATLAQSREVLLVWPAQPNAGQSAFEIDGTPGLR